MDFKGSFCACDIVLPKCDDISKWAVIACDQHTSDVSYWDEVEKYVGGAPSAYNMILPEAFLCTDRENVHKAKIPCQMKAVAEGGGTVYPSSFVFVERELPGLGVRLGIVGAVDLENYGYSGEELPVRPTEGTVADRVPPRVAVRKEAIFEMPHVMLFVNDDKGELFDCAASVASGISPNYDFDLMLGGGHLKGYVINGGGAEKIENTARALEKRHTEEGTLCFGVGDGNHSLAAAKAFWEEKKKSGAPMNSAARWALVELVSIYDSAVVFEPIYRYVTDIDEKHFVKTFSEKMFSAKREGVCKTVELTAGGVSLSGKITLDENTLAVGAVQDFVDAYIAEFGGTCDYVHDEETLFSLCKNGGVGILFDGLRKEELFPYVLKRGALPRKTFSMGNASTKRYYLEMRKIRDR